ncbi:hypothetical protein [Cellulosimicrobium sp. NPDC057862]|uniref:hypothetical protein n=1 Tax=Cellulosimicrobium sp. NPDC057862 TaxID=3346266 RepID=UPI003671C052
MFTALSASAGVPVAVAAGAPGWVLASLGAVAAVSQASQQLLRGRELGTQSHAIAVALSRALRRLRFDSGAITEYQQRRVFEALVEETEGLLSSQDDRMLELMRYEAKAQPPGADVAAPATRD